MSVLATRSTHLRVVPTTSVATAASLMWPSSSSVCTRLLAWVRAWTSEVR